MASITCQPLSDEEIARLVLLQTVVAENRKSFIRIKPGNIILPAAFEKVKDSIKNWHVREDDIYVLTFPKSGTTWTQELVWLLQNDCNFEIAKAKTLDERFPFMDFPLFVGFIKSDIPQFLKGDMLAMLEAIPSPRLLKSHLHFGLFPDDLMEKCKIFMCLRNPKDTVVSYYHHVKLSKDNAFIGDFPAFFDLFMDDLAVYSPYFEYIKEVWQRRNHPNVRLLFFEDMKKDLAASVRKVAKFLGKEVTDAKVEELVDHLSFDSMKSNPAVNKEDANANMFKEDGHFMRKGKIGDWKNYFTDEMNERMDEAIQAHFTSVGLEFQYE